MTRPLLIGTRGSELALRQAELAVAALKAVHGEGFAYEIRIIHTAGDAHTDIPLAEVNRRAGTQDKGVFIAAIEDALARGEIDCAVHSLKDMPGALDARFALSAILPREEVGDVLILKEGADLAHLRIGTSSARRAKLVQCYWGGSAGVMPIRGNVATRIRKLAETPEMSGTILARAGLNRLGYPRGSFVAEGKRLCAVELSTSAFMPALGQGAIALETRRDDAATQALVAAVDDAATSTCVRCERAFLDALKADCSVPVAGFATLVKELLMLRVVYFTPGGQAIRITQTGPAAAPEAVGLQAHAQLLGRLA